MQLIRIGENRQKTVLDMVVEMGDRQFAEMQKLKTAAQIRSKTRRPRRSTPRCGSSERPNERLRRAGRLHRSEGRALFSVA